MAESPRKRQRTTPRNSNANEQAAQVETPYASLRQLASMIREPSNRPYRRAVSTGPGTTPATGGNRTPGTASRTPGTATRTGIFSRPVVARRGPPTTPHAIRALQQRRNAAATPGRTRRKSGRMQRETPRDNLRALSKILAKKTEPIQTTPQVDAGPVRNPLLDDDLDEGSDLRAPRLSIPLDFEDSDDDEAGVAPRLSLAQEDMDDENITANLTAASVESARRAVSEGPRFSRRSLGRLSERFPGINDLSFDAGLGVESDGTFIRGNANLELDDDIIIQDGTVDLDNENTADLRALRDTVARNRSRHSDLGLPGPDDDEEEPTFQFRIERRDRPTQTLNFEDIVRNDNDDDEDLQPANIDPSNLLADAEDLHTSDSDSDLEPHDPVTAQLLRETAEAHDTSHAQPHPKKRQRRALKVSRHGIEYPSLPPSIIKKLATTFARSSGLPQAKINKETLLAIQETSDWFFEQLGEDLGAYAEHAGRKTVEEGDVVALMKRQRVVGERETVFSLGQRFLPRELVGEVRMFEGGRNRGKGKGKGTGKERGRKRRLEAIEEDEEEAIEE